MSTLLLLPRKCYVQIRRNRAAWGSKFLLHAKSEDDWGNGWLIFETSPPAASWSLSPIASLSWSNLLFTQGTRMQLPTIPFCRFISYIIIVWSTQSSLIATLPLLSNELSLSTVSSSLVPALLSLPSWHCSHTYHWLLHHRCLYQLFSHPWLQLLMFQALYLTTLEYLDPACLHKNLAVRYGLLQSPQEKVLPQAVLQHYRRIMFFVLCMHIGWREFSMNMLRECVFTLLIFSPCLHLPFFLSTLCLAPLGLWMSLITSNWWSNSCTWTVVCHITYIASCAQCAIPRCHQTH